jgi:membrane-bound serine protease (ClpP class)
VILLGLALLLAGVLLLIAEAHVVSGGLLGAGGTAAAATGTVLAVQGAGGALALALVVAGLVALSAAGLLVLASVKVAHAASRRPSVGREAMIGRVGRTRSPIAPEGSVLVEGALWRARRSAYDDEAALEPGEPVVVEGVEGLTLSVRRAEPWEVER